MSSRHKTRGPETTSPYTNGKKEPMRALPASWYTSVDMYELERRAIFTQKWILTTHSLRFLNAGDWIKFDTAGYEYVIARDRKGEFHAFHNVCRHRAYPVVENSSGHNQILSCKYHGWTYTLDGKLTKAPWYDDVRNFDRNQNGLFKIHVHIDSLGFIWVNLNASDQPEPWSDEFDNIDKLERYDVYNLNDYAFDHEWEMDADTNWKLCCDNFNECYHCPTSHPTVSTLVDVETLTADSMKGYIIHNGVQDEEQKRNGMKVCTTFYFPNATTNILPNFIILQRFIPKSANKTKMHYQIFRKKGASPELFDMVDGLYKQIMGEDKELANGVQKNMERGVFVNGRMHPRVESGALHLQARTRELVKRHAEAEKKIGRQIWPAVPRAAGDDDLGTRDDEYFCAGLSCPAAASHETIAW